MKFILASKSPRRREMLENIGLTFRILTAETNEDCSEHDPERFVCTISKRKAEDVRRLLIEQGDMTDDTIIIASDTVVVSEGEIMGKPRDREDAARMLRTFSGKSHEVVSGIAILTKTEAFVEAEITSVMFDNIPEEELSRYLDTDEAYDKAGAYAIQGFASLWINGIRGDYFNVVGFPIKHFSDMLKRHLSLSLAKLIK